MATPEEKWRLILGKASDPEGSVRLDTRSRGMDRTLESLYGQDKRGDLSSSKPQVNKWLGDIRTYFPDPVVAFLQKDAVDRLGLQTFLEAPDVLESIVPDIQLATAILQLRDAIPEHTRHTARQVIERMARALERRLELPLVRAVNSGIHRYRNQPFRQNRQLDFHRTIRFNLKHYDPLEKRLIPERLFGYNSRKRVVRELFILLDQSGSMSDSLVYTGIISCLLARIQSIRTHLIVFDSAVADLSDLLQDPVDLLFGIQLGGGTDIGLAMDYARGKMDTPRDSIVFLISDLYDSMPGTYLTERASRFLSEGIKMIVLPALNDSGQHSFDRETADALARIGIPCLSATPETFCTLLPDLLAG